MSDQHPQRRQARGQRRIEQALDAAADVFVEVGYEAATTNAIAARAGMSPGSLYQFFQNKEEIATALAERYINQLQLAQQTAFSADFVHVSLDDLLDHIIDPLISFNIANPGFQVLFADPAVPQRLSRATQHLHDAVLKRVEAMIEARVPQLPENQRTLSAEVSVQLFRALLPLVLSSKAVAREAVIIELKKALKGYLTPVIGAGPSNG